MAQPDFWDNPERAQADVAQLKSLQRVVKPLQEVAQRLDSVQELLELAQEDPSLEGELEQELASLQRQVVELETQALLSGPNDDKGAILTIHARDGGTDANDWAEMLLRMYIQWAKDRGYQVELLDRQDNEEAGINSATVAIRGPLAYGYLKGETGIHRLVRISPFNADGKRQTSFAAVDVSPEITDSKEIEINENDLKVETYCASGPGGQHVNKTASAVRITHLPTGIVVQCQNERSQHKNRAIALKMLQARLARLEEEKREAEQAAKYQQQARVGFGSQIRSYFQHPDQRIKDARTGHTHYSFDDVMNGKIQPFLEAYLRWRMQQEKDRTGAASPSPAAKEG